MNSKEPVFSDLCVCTHVHYGTCVARSLGLTDASFVSDHRHLHKIDVSDNEIESLSPFEGLEELLYLKVTHNKVKALDFEPFIVEVLNVSFNSLTKITSFSAAFLTELDLSHNEITELDELNLPHLRYLNLSFNKITSLEFVPTLPALRTLNVSHNMIDTFQPIVGHSEIKTVDISHNCLASLCTLVPLYSLQSLDLSSNQLSDLRETIDNLKDATSLNTLDVRDNPFCSFESLKVMFTAPQQDTAAPSIPSSPSFGASSSSSAAASSSSSAPVGVQQTDPTSPRSICSKATTSSGNPRLTQLRERLREEFLVGLPLLIQMDGTEITAEEKVLAINHKSLSSYIPPRV
ncbi:putative Leucine-rich repeats and guanylate kinase domain-containing protein [Monocercomonoides exilis]|uniref:putative Leucine-rich repeats and guanylate kinase domain-containing protein n=1 Tax=Monocercomonoides exilis TaxID=2049356 RepID=UPI00355AAF5E|nr:putative Leucine-rich repeats and guanylate kinase domain-containing protein [Monocercomonoides exilis]|eukprot:MONOS_4382.1-p1 / transcript=MONOS_4382.1 / gene=MONOS_4382 / organism=Monocercomonoides_exilis_PA203 / gene_product=Leucine-rich repeats and guanylate kinase domain-containing protein / transcript_product=Leucine-rich repeats and guanylate kinase domain-containing protein / location=Mono_scaffold00116:30501-31724(+) / protein_length=347 / sequence_SO=supercontig / SO=protein_coding / is_pseudo=false